MFEQNGSIEYRYPVNFPLFIHILTIFFLNFFVVQTFQQKNRLSGFIKSGEGIKF